MNRSHHSHLIRRVAGALVGLAALLPSIMTGPAASAAQLRPDPPAWLKRLTVPAHLPAHVHAAPAGGLPGWHIILVAAGAAVLAAVLATLAGRMRASRRRATASTTSVVTASGTAPIRRGSLPR
jgi:hypothetical protein